MAVCGTRTLWLAVFADMGASLLVVASGLRFLQIKTSDSSWFWCTSRWVDRLHRLLFEVRRNYIFSMLGNVFAAQLSGGRPTLTPRYVLASSRSRKSPVGLRLTNPVLCNGRQGRRRARCASPTKRILLTIRIVRIMIYRTV